MVRLEPASWAVGNRVDGLYPGGDWFEASVAVVYGGGAEFMLDWADGDQQHRRQPLANLRAVRSQHQGIPTVVAAAAAAEPAPAKPAAGRQRRATLAAALVLAAAQAEPRALGRKSASSQAGASPERDPPTQALPCKSVPSKRVLVGGTRGLGGASGLAGPVRGTFGMRKVLPKPCNRASPAKTVQSKRPALLLQVKSKRQRQEQQKDRPKVSSGQRQKRKPQQLVQVKQEQPRGAPLAGRAPAAPVAATAEELAVLGLQGGTGKHIDGDPSEPASERPFQAQVVLADQRAGDGSLCVIPGFHHVAKRYFEMVTSAQLPRGGFFPFQEEAHADIVQNFEKEAGHGKNGGAQRLWHRARRIPAGWATSEAASSNSGSCGSCRSRQGVLKRLHELTSELLNLKPDRVRAGRPGWHHTHTMKCSKGTRRTTNRST